MPSDRAIKTSVNNFEETDSVVETNGGSVEIVRTRTEHRGCESIIRTESSPVGCASFQETGAVRKHLAQSQELKLSDAGRDFKNPCRRVT